MKFKGIAIPKPTEGVSFFDVVNQTVPNQSMSLEEILRRFSRGEPVPVGQEVNYSDSDVDLEKLKNLDLVDREEYINSLNEVKKKFELQEKRKAEAEKVKAAEREKALQEKKIRLAAKKLAASKGNT